MTANKINTINVEQFKDRIFFTLTPHRWGARAKVKSAEAHREYLRLKDLPLDSADNNGNGNGASYTPTNRSEVDKTTTTKELLDSEKLDAINEFINDAKDRLIGKLKGLANPSFIARGIYSLKKSDIARVESMLEDASRKIRNELAPAFEADFEPAKLRARDLPCNRGGLGPIYDESDYPSAQDAASKFSLEWSYLALGVPDDLPAELRAQKEAEFNQKLTDAYEETINALRVSFAELIAHATEKLTVAPGEKPKVFRDSLIGNIDSFIEAFTSRNMGDAALEDLVNKAKAIVRPNGETIDPDKLRKFANVRDNVREQFASIQSTLDGMIVERKGRKIDLSDED